MSNKKEVKMVNPKEMSTEERLAVAQRSYTQRFQSFAEQIMYTLIHDRGVDLANPKPIVKYALALAAEFMENAGAASDESFAKFLQAEADKVKKEDEQ